MNDPGKVLNIPDKPVMVYDGDCRFCTLWVRRWQQTTRDAVDYVPLQDERVSALYPELPRKELEKAVHFVDTDGVVCHGAAAVFKCLSTNPSRGLALRLYQGFPVFARASEAGYRFVAEHRSLFSWLTRILWGDHVERARYPAVRRAFLVWLGAIYLIAFISLWTQIPGLVGKNGILPATDLMSQAGQTLTANGAGLDRYRLLPTLCWFGTSDGFLEFQCVAGAVLAALLMAGITPPVCLVLLWVLYISLTTVCREFLGFQWDNLLLETGLLAIFFAPWQIIPGRPRQKPPSRTMLWLLRLLLFKLMFLSGVVKLASGDPAWRNLTALTRHYETQPLPTWVAWHVHQFPLWFQKGSCAAMFVIELAVPFLIFAPRRPRMAGGAILALFQVLIILTGNYTFFNWLTLGLCLLLLDDFALATVFRRKVGTENSESTTPLPAAAHDLPRWRWSFGAVILLAILFVSISMVQVLSPLGLEPSWMSPVVDVYRWILPFRSVNSYGLFAVMTMERPEIIVEGSNDGRDWKEYGFPYKPGDLQRRPKFVAPHQPRLDWQMWFAALGDYRQNPWFVHFCIKLLQGSPEVLSLLETNPFPDRPPKYIRSRLYNYEFTSREERQRTNAWWKRELKGEYLPPLSLDMLQSSARQMNDSR